MTIPKNKRNTAYHHGDLRNALLHVALREVERSGAENISVRALARSIGVTHRAAFVHFKTKDTLIAAVIASAYDRLTKAFEDVGLNALPPEKSLMQIAEIYAEFAFANPNLFFAMSGPRINPNNQFPELEKALRRAWKFIQVPISSGCETGVFSCDADVNAVFFWGGLQGILNQSLLGRIKLSKVHRMKFFEKSALMLIKGLKT